MNDDPVAAVPPEPAGAWLMSQSLAYPDKLVTAMWLIADGDRSNDACLLARQFLEHALGAAAQRPRGSSGGPRPALWASVQVSRKPGSVSVTVRANARVAA